MKTKIKTKLIRMNLWVILPILALVLLLTVFTIDRYQLENTKKTLLYDSYLLQVYLNQYLTISRKDLLSEKEIYFLNHDLSRMVKLRTQTFYLRGEVYVDSEQEGSAVDRGAFLQDQGVKLALENQKNYTIIKMDRHRSFLINFPFYCDGDLVGVMRLTYPLGEEDTFRNRLFIALSTIGLFVVLVLGKLLAYFTGQIVTPLTKLQYAVQTFAEGRLTEDLQINSGDEVEELAASFRQMTTKIHSLIENLKIEQNKQENFFNQMTHEFRTPITTIIGYADIINKMGSPEERAECSKYIISESNRLLRMVEDILGSSMLKTYTLNLNKTRSDLDQLLRESIQIMKYKADKYGVELNLYSEKTALLEFDRDKIKQVILNMIDNAINHSKTEQVDIHLYRGPKRVAIAIRDYGQGIPAQRLEQIKKRFLGMDLEQIPTSNGHGFGLPLSARIMHLHNGKLLIRTAEDGGTTVFLLFRKY